MKDWQKFVSFHPSKGSTVAQTNVEDYPSGWTIMFPSLKGFNRGPDNGGSVPDPANKVVSFHPSKGSTVAQT